MRKSLALISLMFLITPRSGVAQNSAIDSLVVVISSAQDDSLKVDKLIELSKLHIGTDNEKTISYASEARNLAAKLNYQAGVAQGLKYVGVGKFYEAKYLDAIDYFEQALIVFNLIGDKNGVSNMLNNLGTINNNQGDETKALELYFRALAVAQESQDSFRIAGALVNIGVIYADKPETNEKALDFYLQSLPIFEELMEEFEIGNVAYNLGDVYYDLGDDSTALFYYEKSIQAYDGKDEMAYKLIAIGKVYAKRGEISRALKIQEEAYEIAVENGAKLDMAIALIALGNTYSMNKTYRMAIQKYLMAIPIVENNEGTDFKNEMRDAYTGLSDAYEQIREYKNAFKYQELLTAIKDTLFYSANQKKLDLINANFENEKQEGEIDLLTKEQALQEANLQKEKIVKNTFLGGFVVIFVIAFIIFRNYRNKVKTNKLLDKQNEEIEGLLLNILPAEVAKELQHEGYATPQNYESATVLFTDFKGFTQISSGLLPHELIAELNSYFNEFDDIIGKHNLEKIKTIGDAYMCAGGVPSANTTHATDAVEAGLAIQQYIARKNDKRKADGLVPWELRIGIHTGPIVAGVVGRKKYAYDIWGDAVNIASRMESNGEACKVNISQATYKLVKDKFKCVARGKISVKGAGEKKMYFVDGPIDEKTKGSEIQNLASKDLTAS